MAVMVGGANLAHSTCFISDHGMEHHLVIQVMLLSHESIVVFGNGAMRTVSWALRLSR